MKLTKDHMIVTVPLIKATARIAEIIVAPDGQEESIPEPGKQWNQLGKDLEELFHNFRFRSGLKGPTPRDVMTTLRKNHPEHNGFTGEDVYHIIEKEGLVTYLAEEHIDSLPEDYDNVDPLK